MAKKSPKTKKPSTGKAGKIGKQTLRRGPRTGMVPIIGIGASAGGLEALEGLFAGMPADIDAAFVVVQHLDPHHKSLMGELLQPFTQLKVVQIEDGLAPRNGCLYINPPNRMVGLMSRTFCLSSMDKTQVPRLPIDHFFRTMADDLKEQAIGIVLSGTGTDATLGINAIKGQGGMTIVQDEAQAAYPGMPSSAISTGSVDMVLPVEKIGPELRNYLHHPYIADKKTRIADDSFDQFLKKILLLIRNATGNDFAGYKPNTIRRRIERRMALHQLTRINDYYRYAEQNPAEIEILFKDLLIGVTNFFRDPEAFEALATKALPAMVRNKRSQSPMRIWVPGCATGEEAYSLAIILVETMEKYKAHFNVQIFATDIDEEAIAFARQGTFQDNIIADVSKTRLRRFFVKSANTYIVNKQIRDMIVFANQNLINDPPFSKLDLVSCRNLLIYMNTDLQKQILPLFHFTLKVNGILFLGNSESIGAFAELFSPIDAKWKLFKRKEVLLEDMNEYPVPPLVQPSGSFRAQDDKALPKVISSRSIAEKMILEHYAPASVLINGKFDILFFIGDTSRYLMPPVGEPNVNILKMVHKEIRYKLSLTINNVVKRNKQVVTNDISLQREDVAETLKITITPVSDIGIPPGLMMVVFESQGASKIKDHPDQVNAGQTDEISIDPEISNLEQELKYTRENLQTTIEELETSNEELKSTNEELQSTNEELQSTNEELETSKEEMHSTNEELVTINAELQNKVKELEGVNNDINNLLASTEIATLFLDDNLNIRRFTPAVSELFNVIEGDIGRAIGDITSVIEYDALQSDAEQVLEKLIPIEIDLKIKQGGWVSMKMLPYRTFENVIDGVVITFMEITKIKQAESKLSRLAPMLPGSPHVITMQDISGQIVHWSKEAAKLYGWSKSQALKKTIYKMMPEDTHTDYKAMIKDLKSQKLVPNFQTQRQTKAGETLDVCMTVTLLPTDDGKSSRFVTSEWQLSGDESLALEKS